MFRRKKKQTGWLKRKRGSPKQIGKAFYVGPSYKQKKDWQQQKASISRAFRGISKAFSKVKREVSPALTESQLADEMIEMAEKGDVSAENWLYEHEYEYIEEKEPEPEPEETEAAKGPLKNLITEGSEE